MREHTNPSDNNWESLRRLTSRSSAPAPENRRQYLREISAASSFVALNVESVKRSGATPLFNVNSNNTASLKSNGQPLADDLCIRYGKIPLQPIAAPPLAPDPGTERALACLEKVAGLDVARGLSVLGGSAVKYLYLLGCFVENSLDEIQQIVPNDHSGAHRVANNLKSMAGTLGLDQLAAKAASLERSLRIQSSKASAASEVQRSMQAIRQELVILAAALTASPGPTPTSELMELVDAKTLMALMNELETLLVQSDTAAISLVENNSVVVRALFGPPAELLTKLLMRFQFGPALAVLRDLRASSPAVLGQHCSFFADP